VGYGERKSQKKKEVNLRTTGNSVNLNELVGKLVGATKVKTGKTARSQRLSEEASEGEMLKTT